MESSIEIYKNDVEANLKNILKYKLDILTLQNKNEDLCKENDEEIKRLINKVGELEREMKINLKGSGESKIDTPAGFCDFKKMQDKWIYVDSEIISWCKAKNMPYYHTVTEEIVDRLKLKNAILEGKIKLTEVLGITVTPQDPKFHYKIKYDI